VGGQVRLEAMGIQTCSGEPVDVFFSPFAYIWPHERLEISLRRSLLAQNRRLVVIRCSGSLWNLCHVREAVGPKEKELSKGLCQRCQSAAEIGLDSSQVVFLPGKRGLQTGPELFDDHVRALLQRFVTHDYLLNMRMRPSDLGDKDNERIFSLLDDALKLYSELHTILSKQNVRQIYYYNDVYAVNRVAKLLASKFSVPTVNLQLSELPALMSDHYLSTPSQEHLLELHRSDRHVRPLSWLTCYRVRRSFKFQRFGRSPFIYSSPSRRGRPNRGGLKYECTLILSSHDEMQSLQYLLPDTLSGAKYEHDEVIEWFLRLARNFPDLSFVIRPHPREYSNRRHPTESSSAESNARWADGAPPNIKFDHPALKTPLYDLIRVSRTVVFTWSSTGLDALLLGKPTACAAPGSLTWCPPSLFTSVESLEDVSKFVQEAGHSEKFDEQRLAALRWYGWFVQLNHNRFSVLRYRISPSRLVQGLHGRTAHFFPRLLAMTISLETKLSLRLRSKVASDHQSETLEQSDANRFEKRTLRLLERRGY